MVVNSDVYSDFDFARLRPVAAALASGGLAAHLVLVDNPPHHPEGDFCLRDGRVTAVGPQRLTFSGIGVYAPALFAPVARATPCQLVTLLEPAMAQRRVSGEHHRGLWIDVGTPQRLAELERVIASRAAGG